METLIIPEYNSRESKAKFTYNQYKDILTGKILDVGADQCHLKKYLGKDVQYTGVGFGDNENIVEMDLEKEPLPFADNSFDCVVCLDVLEHLENIHDVFDDLCRISSKWVIVSLPNPARCFFRFLTRSKYKTDRSMKFYGLPKEKEADRHKWFFTFSEAKEFIQYRAKKNGFEITNILVETDREDKLTIKSAGKSIKKFINQLLKRKPYFHLCQDLYQADIMLSTSWFTMKKVADDMN